MDSSLTAASSSSATIHVAEEATELLHSAEATQPARSVESTSARKEAANTTWGAAKLLNSLSPEQCGQILAPHITQAVNSANGCLFAAVKTTNGNYPRVQIPRRFASSLPADVQSALRADDSKKGALKVALHQLQWRAQGNQLPAYSSGNDLSHTCKRGMVVCQGKSSVVPHTVRRGCFSAGCLRLETHSVNLKRGLCASLVQCAVCARVARVCEHQPKCSASDELEAAFKAQKTGLVSVTFNYADGTTETVAIADV